MFKTLFVLALFTFSLTQAFAQNQSSIKISSETVEIYLGDVIILDIESIGLVEPLDVAPLLATTNFTRESTGTRIAVYSAKVVEIVLRRMVFIPEQAGTYVFGPLEAMGEDGLITSNAVSIKVLPALTTKWEPDPSDATISITTSKPNPIFGEQVLLTIELEHRYPIADETITLPALAQFDVVAIHEERRTIDNETNVRKLSWHYLIHPKISGKIVLDEVHWSGTMNRSRTQRGRFEQSSEALTMDVQQTTFTKGDWWVPATNLKLSEAWSKDVKTLSAGDEIIRTITIVADGILASQLPDVTPLQSRAIQTDAINTERTQTIENERTTATGIYTFRVTALSPIPVFLDTVRVPWWNVETNESKDAIIPARRINVGLPDKANVLAELSLNGSFKERWLYRLQSIKPSVGLTYAVLALFLLLWLLIPSIPNLKKSMAQSSLRRKLKKLVRKKDWIQVYKTLEENGSQIENTTRKQLIINQLNHLLFDNASSTSHTKPVTKSDIEALFIKEESPNTTNQLQLPSL